MAELLWRTEWRLLNKLGIKLLYYTKITLLGTNPGETTIKKDTCTPVFIAALFTISRIGKKTRCPSAEEWIRKL